MTEHKGKEFLIRFHLEYRRVVIAEMVIGSLPQVSVGLCNDFYLVNGYGKAGRLPGPLKVMDIEVHTIPPGSFGISASILAAAGRIVNKNIYPGAQENGMGRLEVFLRILTKIFTIP